MARKVLAGLALFVLAGAGAASAQTLRPWLHVQVDEGDKSRVSVNLPLSLVQIALASAPQTVFSDGHFRLHSGDSRLSVVDMRKLWQELKGAGDTDFVTVEEDDETVTVSRKGDLVLVRVDSPTRKESVRVDLPVSLVDVLLAGEGDQVNIQQALAEISKRRGDVVNVKDAKSTVRVWIDERN
jgi:hypothetical protein